MLATFGRHSLLWQTLQEKKSGRAVQVDQAIRHINKIGRLEIIIRITAHFRWRSIKNRSYRVPPPGAAGALGAGPLGGLGLFGPLGGFGLLGPLGGVGLFGPFGDGGLSGLAGGVGLFGPLGGAGLFGPFGLSGFGFLGAGPFLSLGCRGLAGPFPGGFGPLGLFGGLLGLFGSFGVGLPGCCGF
jgi:hypothetical protein